MIAGICKKRQSKYSPGRVWPAEIAPTRPLMGVFGACTQLEQQAEIFDT